MPKVAYKTTPIADVDIEAFEAWVDWPDIVVEGPCPRCGEDTRYRHRLVVILGVMRLTPEQEQRAYESMRETAGEDPKEADLTVYCMCSGEHKGRPDDKAHGCGAYWGFHAEW
jgi:hypothetical protein